MMRALLRTPSPDEPVTLTGTVQDICAGIVVVLLIAVAVLVLP